MSKATTMSPLLIALMLLAACGGEHKQPPADRAPPASSRAEPLLGATIVGSAESPDPVLQRVMELEKQGVVEDVTVMESFPVQIRLRAPQRVIDELQRMPRKGALR